jgi:hypothetical protein
LASFRQNGSDVAPAILSPVFPQIGFVPHFAVSLPILFFNFAKAEPTPKAHFQAESGEL